MNIQGFSPTMAAPIQAQGANSAAATTGTSSTSGSTSSTSSNNLQSTFLNLLVTELQNQDPTSPVDPTEMVSQMVSLNQLDQLISINQTLSSLTSAPTSTPGATTSSQPAATSQIAQQAASVSPNAFLQGSLASQGYGSSAGTPSPILSSLSHLQGPAELLNGGLPKAIMNLYSGFRNATLTPQSTQTGGR